MESKINNTTTTITTKESNNKDIKTKTNNANKKNNKKYDILIEWFQKEFKDNNDKILIALSGGVDSAVVALAAKKALGKLNVLAVTANYQKLSN